jgi:TatD DNase family protein
MIDYIDIHTHHLKKDSYTFSIFNISLPCNDLPEDIYFSAGWHPWYIGAFDLIQIENTLEEITHHKNVIVIGECGLDRAINTPIEKQYEVFMFHIELAKKYGKPLIIHCVRAYSDLLEILKNERFEGRFVLHNFNGNQFQIDSFLKFEAYFSFGRQLIRPDRKLTDSMKYIPIERIFLETDDSEFPVSMFYDIASNLLQIPVDVLKIQINENCTKLLGNSLLD